MQLDFLIAELDGLRIVEEILPVFVAENGASFTVAEVGWDEVLAADGREDVVEFGVGCLVEGGDRAVSGRCAAEGST